MNKNEQPISEIPEKIIGHSGEYELFLHVGDAVYYTNNMETDENANTMVFDTDMNMLSDNYFAFNDLFGELQELARNPKRVERVKFCSEACKTSIEEMKKELGL